MTDDLNDNVENWMKKRKTNQNIPPPPPKEPTFSDLPPPPQKNLQYHQQIPQPPNTNIPQFQPPGFIPTSPPITYPHQQNTPIHPIVLEYIKTLKKNLKWVPKKRKEQFCQEVLGHIYEIASQIPGDDQIRFSTAINRFGDAKAIAGEYVEAFGFGKKYLIFMSVIGFFLSLLTIPLQIPFQPQTRGVCMGLPLLMTIIVFFFIIRISIKAGKWTGFTVGLTCGASRLLALGILFDLIASNPDIEDKINIPGGVVFGIILVSLLMIISGYLPGRTIQKYQV